MKAKLRYYLRKTNNLYYKVNAGSVILDSTKRDIGSGLMNWDDISLTWNRDSTNKGIIRKYANDLKFVLDGAKILRYLYYTQGGIMADCELYIEVLDDTTQQYIELFTCGVDFSKFDSQRDYVTVDLFEKGLHAYIKAYDTMRVDIPISQNDLVKVLMDGIILKTQYRYLISPATSGMAIGSSTTPQVLRHVFVRQEGDLASGYGSSSDADPYPAFRLPIFVASFDTVVVYEYDFNMQITATGANNAARIYYELWSGNPGSSTLLDTQTIYTTSVVTAGSSTNIHVVDKKVLSMASGNNFIIMVAPTVTLSGLQSIGVNSLSETVCYIKTQTNSAQSTDDNVNTRWGYRWWQVLDKVIRKITNSQYGLRSNCFVKNAGLQEKNYYDAIPYNNVIVSEQSLKGYDNPVIKTTLRDILTDGLSRMGIGIGFDGNEVFAEELSYFYKNTVIAEITDVSTVEISTLEDCILNMANIGYDGGDGIDDLNKVNEYNITSTYQWPNTMVFDSNNNALDLVSPFFAAMNYIELVRAQNYKNTISVNNTKRDDQNRVFVVHISNSKAANGSYLLNRNATIYGIEFPEKAYNAALTPARNKFRNAPLIKSYLYGLNNQVLTFQSNDNNLFIKTTFPNSPAGTIIEAENTDFKNVSTPALYQPVIMKVNGVPPYNWANIMASNPYGAIQFTYRGKIFKGYIKKCVYQSREKKIS